VVVPLALLFAAMAFSMFGAFELALPPGLQARLSRVGGSGFRGAFLMGLVGGLIAAPCTGPPLAGILAYVATTRNAIMGFLLLATYATGIGLPFWAIAGWSMQLPKSGRWMEGVKTVFGIALLTAALYYLKNVVPTLRSFSGASSTFLFAVLAAVVLGLAMGAINLSFHAAPRERARKAVGIALVVAGAFGATNYLLAPAAHLAWLRSETDAVATARAGGKPLLIDFSANWCLPCQELEANVFSNPTVTKALDQFTLLKVDLSVDDGDDSIAVLRKKYHVDTLPAVRLVSPDGEVLASVDALITVPDFLQLLDKARS
jgi:thiol:disulfide interchange protein DsbD